MKEELYFRHEFDTTCYPLEWIKQRAKEEGLEEIEAFKAIPDPVENIYWCQYHSMSVEREYCNKKCCAVWERYMKSNVCRYRSNS